MKWPVIEKSKEQYLLIDLLFFKYGERITVFLKKCQVKVKKEVYDLIVWTTGEESGVIVINETDDQTNITLMTAQNMRSKFHDQIEDGLEFSIIQSYPIQILNFLY